MQGEKKKLEERFRIWMVYRVMIRFALSLPQSSEKINISSTKPHRNLMLLKRKLRRVSFLLFYEDKKWERYCFRMFRNYLPKYNVSCFSFAVGLPFLHLSHYTSVHKVRFSVLPKHLRFDPVIHLFLLNLCLKFRFLFLGFFRLLLLHSNTTYWTTTVGGITQTVSHSSHGITSIYT